VSPSGRAEPAANAVDGPAGFPVTERVVFDPPATVDHSGYFRSPAFDERLLA